MFVRIRFNGWDFKLAVRKAVWDIQKERILLIITNEFQRKIGTHVMCVVGLGILLVPVQLDLLLVVPDIGWIVSVCILLVQVSKPLIKPLSVWQA